MGIIRRTAEGSPRSLSRRRAGLWAAGGVLAAGLVAGATTAVVSASQASGSPTTSSGTAATASPDASSSTANGTTRGQAAKQGAALLHRLATRTLHGELVVRAKDATRTVLIQRGEIAKVDAGSLTVTSTDGFSATYALTSTTRIPANRNTASASALHAGEQVAVLAQRSGGTVSATLVRAGEPKGASTPKPTTSG